MNSNNTLLTISTVALVLTANVAPANAENFRDTHVIMAQAKTELAKQRVVSFFDPKVDCKSNPGHPDCRPNDDYMCIAA